VRDGVDGAVNGVLQITQRLQRGNQLGEERRRQFRELDVPSNLATRTLVPTVEIHRDLSVADLDRQLEVGVDSLVVTAEIEIEPTSAPRQTEDLVVHRQRGIGDSEMVEPAKRPIRLAAEPRFEPPVAVTLGARARARAAGEGDVERAVGLARHRQPQPPDLNSHRHHLAVEQRGQKDVHVELVESSDFLATGAAEADPDRLDVEGIPPSVPGHDKIVESDGVRRRDGVERLFRPRNERGQGDRPL